MKKILKKTVMLLLAGTMLFGIAFMENSMPVQAGGAKAKLAVKAYQKFLGQSQIEWSGLKYSSSDFQFILADVNSDGVPELLLYNQNKTVSHYQGYQAVYYYNNKKVVRAVVEDEIVGYYPKKGIVVNEHHGMGGARYYNKVPKNGKKPASKVGYINMLYPNKNLGEKTMYIWYSGKKEIEISKSAFISRLKKVAGSKIVNIKSSQWKDNTAANRKKMSKWKK